MQHFNKLILLYYVIIIICIIIDFYMGSNIVVEISLLCFIQVSQGIYMIYHIKQLYSDQQLLINADYAIHNRLRDLEAILPVLYNN